MPTKKELPPKQEPTRPRCPDCKFKIRGKNHDKGTHHKQGKKK